MNSSKLYKILDKLADNDIGLLSAKNSLSSKISSIEAILEGFSKNNTLNDRFNELLNKIDNMTGSFNVAENDPYIAVNSENKLYSLSGNIDRRIDEKINEYDLDFSSLSSEFSKFKNIRSK